MGQRFWRIQQILNLVSCIFESKLLNAFSGRTMGDPRKKKQLQRLRYKQFARGLHEDRQDSNMTARLKRMVQQRDVNVYNALLDFEQKYSIEVCTSTSSVSLRLLPSSI